MPKPVTQSEGIYTEAKRLIGPRAPEGLTRNEKGFKARTVLLEQVAGLDLIRRFASLKRVRLGLDSFCLNKWRTWA
jgi:hypothetical protein